MFQDTQRSMLLLQHSLMPLFNVWSTRIIVSATYFLRRILTIRKCRFALDVTRVFKLDELYNHTLSSHEQKWWRPRRRRWWWRRTDQVINLFSLNDYSL